MDDADRTLLNLLARELANEPVIVALGPPASAYTSSSESGLRVSCLLYDMREPPAARNLPPASHASPSLRLRATWCITVVQAAGPIAIDADLLARHRLLTRIYLALWRDPVLTDDVLAGVLLEPSATPEGRLVTVPAPGDRFWANIGLPPQPSVHFAIEFNLPAG